MSGARLWTSTGYSDDVFVAAARLHVTAALARSRERQCDRAASRRARTPMSIAAPFHLALELSENVVLSPFEKSLYARHKLRIRVGIRFARTGSRAQLELVVEARPENAP